MRREVLKLVKFGMGGIGLCGTPLSFLATTGASSQEDRSDESFVAVLSRHRLSTGTIGRNSSPTWKFI